jgi:hypothetical protein
MMKSGIYLIDLQKLLHFEQPPFFRLARCIVGNTGKIDISFKRQRMAFLRDFGVIRVHQVPHRSEIRLMGMKKKDNYFIMRKKNGFISALDTNMRLHTWSLITGSHIYDYPITDF